MCYMKDQRGMFPSTNVYGGLDHPLLMMIIGKTCTCTHHFISFVKDHMDIWRLQCTFRCRCTCRCRCICRCTCTCSLHVHIVMYNNYEYTTHLHTYTHTELTLLAGLWKFIPIKSIPLMIAAKDWIVLL